LAIGGFISRATGYAGLQAYSPEAARAWNRHSYAFYSIRRKPIENDDFRVILAATNALDLIRSHNRLDWNGL
jgi:hypothetical protein